MLFSFQVLVNPVLSLPALVLSRPGLLRKALPLRGPWWIGDDFDDDGPDDDFLAPCDRPSDYPGWFACNMVYICWILPFCLWLCHTLDFICTLSSSFCNLPYNPPREISKSKLTLRLKLQLHEKTLKLNIRRRVMSSADVARPEEQKQTLCNNNIWAIISPVSVCTFFYAFLPSFFLDEEYFCEAPF